jgi:hypothetical protein
VPSVLIVTDPYVGCCDILSIVSRLPLASVSFSSTLIVTGTSSSVVASSGSAVGG